MNTDATARSTILVFLVVILMLIAGGALLLLTRPEPVQITINPPIPTQTPAPTATHEAILVYITGEVNEPESTISLPYNSRVSDAIEAVGGLTDNANTELVNMAGILRDGDQIHVPAISANTAENPEALPTASGGGIVFINSATAEELQTLPGIGEATAANIIAYRDENGSFTSLDDLDNVSGIGAATLENLAPLISFE